MAPKRKLSESSKAARERAPKRTKAMVEDKQYFVEYIWEEQMKGGVLKYHVKWRGYPVEQATWVPREDISDDSFAEYEDQKREREEGEEQEKAVQEGEMQEGEGKDDEEVQEEEDGEGKEKEDTSLESLARRAVAKLSVSTGGESVRGNSIEHERTDSSRVDPRDDQEEVDPSAGARIAYSQSSATTDASFEYDDYVEPRVPSPGDARNSRRTETVDDEAPTNSSEEVEAVVGVDLGLGRFWEAQ